MKQKKELPLYEPPRARDLSITMAKGDDVGVTGECYDGPKPYEQCAFGPDPGGQNPACAPWGGDVLGFNCVFGSNAQVECGVGGDA